MPPGALAGLCPACLLAQGLETDAGEAAGQHRFVPPSLEDIARLFPQLEILGLLGAGGMGAVYKARQPALDRIVALKVLPTAGATGVNFEERFNREARALARLSHPNIVAVYEFGHAGDLHFFLMEFVDGANLRQLEKTGRLAPREALQIIPQICDALQYAHDEGVVHRDIKPENVLVDRKGRVKIADFGLAKILGQDTESLRLTAEGQVMGTPHYMAPEQVEKPLSVDHRADIYSLGVVFYEMLTGDLPLGKFSPPSRKYQLDVRFDEVVLRALENDPARRYQHASEVKSRVETIAGTPAASPVPAGQRLRKGLPLLVVEREGVRNVSWRGVLAVFALTFGILTVAFGLVTSLTGRSVMGWVGVIGWPSLIARLLMAGLFVGWKVRRALQDPLKEEPPRTPLGTVILSPRISRWASVARAVVFIVFCIGVWIWFQDRWLLPYLKSHFEKVSNGQVAVRDDQTGKLVAKLPGGGSVELLAIGEPDAALNGWWTPDGSPIVGTTFEVEGGVRLPTVGRKEIDLLFRTTGLQPGAARMNLESDSSFGSGSGGQVIRDGKPLHSGWQARLAVKPTARDATVRLSFGLEPWRTIATDEVIRQSMSESRLPTDPFWRTQFHRPPYGSKDDAHVGVAFNPSGRRWTHQVVAVDTNDVEHAPNDTSITLFDEMVMWTCAWRDLPMPRVKEFRLQVRPVHWVEFRDLTLKPKSPVPPPSPARFGPVMEKTFSELIDFDTGKTSGYPPTRPGANPFKGLGENVLWMQKNGFDAEAGGGSLQVVNMEFVALENAVWDTQTAPQVVDRLDRGSRFAPRNLKPLKEGQFPATFVFRTRERGIGLLQLLGFDEAHGVASVRYKLIAKPAVE